MTPTKVSPCHQTQGNVSNQEQMPAWQGQYGKDRLRCRGDTMFSPVLVVEALLSSYGLEFGPYHFLAAMRGVGLRSWPSAVGWLLTALGK